MAIIRITKTKNFVTISNAVFSDKTISFKAKGILAYLLAKPNDWQVYIEQLAKASIDGREAVTSGINELIEAGYIYREKVIDEKGRFGGMEYFIYEDKLQNQSEKPITEKPISDIPISENATLLNTDYTKTERTKTEIHTHTQRTEKIPNSANEVILYGNEIHLSRDECEKFYDYFLSNGWKVGGKTPMRDWKASLRNWQRNLINFNNKQNGNNTNGNKQRYGNHREITSEDLERSLAIALGQS